MSTRPTDHTATLLPPSATPFERDLEQATARMSDVATSMDTLYNAATCPAHLLGWLAWALSVDEWDPAWPEDVKRDAIRIAPLLHQRKGTVWALQNALEPLGTTTRIEEWFAMQPMGAPGTFRATTLINRDDISGPGPLLTPALTQKFKAIIDRTKPVSRSYSLRIGVGITARQRETTALRPALNMHLTVQPCTTHHLMIAHHSIASTLRPAMRVNLCMVPTQ